MESNWVHSALRPLNGLLCQPRVIMMMEKSAEWLAGETEVLGENLPNAALSTTNPTCYPEANPGRHAGKPVTNRLSYGTAFMSEYLTSIMCFYRIQLAYQVARQSIKQSENLSALTAILKSCSGQS
jgi:hypothetical protein